MSAPSVRALRRALAPAAAALIITPALSAQSLDELVPDSPAPTSFVADVPGVIPADARSAIDGRIRELQAAGRGDIGVAILPSIGGYQPYEVGVAIYRDWGIGSVAGIGDARRDLGALLLIVPKELAPDGVGHCWITTGLGAEGPLTDAASGVICREYVVPHLRERDYASAVLAGVNAIDSVLAADSALAGDSGRAAAAAGGGRSGSPLPWIGGILASLVTLAGSVFGIRRWRRTRPRTCQDCGARMRRLDEAADDAALAPGQQVEERVKSVDYDVWVCDACGARRVERYGRWITEYRDCPACSAKTARTRRKTLRSASTSRTGLAEDMTTCEACGYSRVEQVVLPKVSSSSSGGGSGGGRSGGSSFGGSGRTGGGGGGARY